MLTGTSLSAQAATYCITQGDVSALGAALADASINGETDVIELQAGHYSVPANFLLSYIPTAADQAGSLVIEGGYGPNFGNDCGTAPVVPDATATTLEGGLWRMRLADNDATITLRGLTLQSAFSADAIHPTIEIGADPNSIGDIRIENVVFNDNSSLVVPAIYLMAGKGRVSVENSLFASTVGLGPSSPIKIGSSGSVAFCTTIVNSTFAATASSAPALQVSSPNCETVVANDIFWNNPQGGSLVFDAPDHAYLFSDNIADATEAIGTNFDGITSLDPAFEADFSLRDGSPMRNRGNPGGGAFGISSFDVVGQPRVYDLLPDIGAYEIQDVVFAYDFDIDFDPN